MSLSHDYGRMRDPPMITNAQVREWNDAIKDWHSQTRPLNGYCPQHPAFLWKFCWEQLNTIKIPIVSSEAFFRQAIKIAKSRDTVDSTSFMTLFARAMSRVEDLSDGYFHVAQGRLEHGVFYHELGDNPEVEKLLQPRNPYSPTQEAKRLVHEAYNDYTFMSFVQLMGGITSGWRPDSTIQNEENYVPRSCGPSRDDIYDGCYGHDYIHPNQFTSRGNDERDKQKRYVLLDLLNSQY